MNTATCETQYLVITRLRLNDGMDYAAGDHQFERQSDAVTFALDTLDEEGPGYQHPTYALAIIETNMETGETRQIADRFKLIQMSARRERDRAEAEQGADDEERLYGSYVDQHRLRLCDVIGRAA